MKCEALESLSISAWAGTKAGCHLGHDCWGFRTPWSEPGHSSLIRTISGQTPSDKDPFEAMDPAPTIGCPLGNDVAAAPGYKPVDHIKAALHRLQVGIPPVAPP